MYPKLDFEKVKRRVMWDFRLEDEKALFYERRTGYAFIIDVLGGRPQLALYHVTRFGSKTEYFDTQPRRICWSRPWPSRAPASTGTGCTISTMNCGSGPRKTCSKGGASRTS